MKYHSDLTDRDLGNQIRNEIICFGGNNKLKIFGTLQCSSGKRMKKGNRVFFNSVQEARKNGFRPCGHCMRADYKKWKNGFI